MHLDEQAARQQEVLYDVEFALQVGPGGGFALQMGPGGGFGAGGLGAGWGPGLNVGSRGACLGWGRDGDGRVAPTNAAHECMPIRASRGIGQPAGTCLPRIHTESNHLALLARPQEMERKLSRAQGHRTEDETRALRTRIEELTASLAAAAAEHAMLVDQVRGPADRGGRGTWQAAWWFGPAHTWGAPQL